MLGAGGGRLTPQLYLGGDGGGSVKRRPEAQTSGSAARRISIPSGSRAMSSWTTCLPTSRPLSANRLKRPGRSTPQRSSCLEPQVRCGLSIPEPSRPAFGRLTHLCKAVALRTIRSRSDRLEGASRDGLPAVANIARALGTGLLPAGPRSAPRGFTGRRAGER